MKKRDLSLVLAALIVLVVATLAGRPSCAQNAPGATSKALDAQEVAATIKRVADWQLAHPVRFDPRHWAVAPLYNGLIDASEATGEPKYLAAVIRAGNRVGWRLGPMTYHADDQAVGRAWLKIYLMDRTKAERLEPIKNRMDAVLANPIDEPLSFTASPRSRGVERTDRWTWSDALYMAPPTLGQLTKATNDERYLKFVDIEYKAAYDQLYDRQEKLFYRDSRFIGQRTPTGQKVFWSRGNGWVYAGLAALLDAMPANYGNRAFYVDLFREMTPAVVTAQQPDGLWYPSLKDPNQIPVGETSGSALFLYGLASGVRQGILDRATYWPVVERGWNGLLTRIAPDGTVSSVQPIGAEPEAFDLRSQAPFGSGSVLGAGCQILRALGADPKLDPAKLIRDAEVLVSVAPDLST